MFLLLIISFLIIKNFTREDVCPYCKNKNELTRVKKNKLVYVIPYIRLIRISCGDCFHKHYRLVKYLRN